MTNDTKTILVSGATGQQGNAVVRCLLADGWRVKALTRNPDNPVAQALADAGAELVRGDLFRRDTIDPLLKDTYGVFSAQQFWEHGVDGEVRQGKLLADAAKAADVEHFVYSSAAGADRQTGIHHFNSKWEIEEYVWALGLNATVIRPTGFMENFYFPGWLDGIRNGTLAIPLAADKPCQYIAADDIGAFAAIAFNRREEFEGKSIDIAAEELTGPEAAESLSRASGRPINYLAVPITNEFRETNEDLALMYEWISSVGFEPDNIATCHKHHPEIMTLETWARKTRIGQVDAEVPASSMTTLRVQDITV